MARRKLPKIKEPKERKPRAKRTPKYPLEKMDMALLEFVRSGGSTWEAEKISGIHHTAIQRAWDALTEEERNGYRGRARDICEAVEEKVFENTVLVVSEVTSKLKEISDLALDELRDRLKDDLRRAEIKDADLLNIATKTLAIVDENTRLKEQEDAKTTPQSVTYIYNILDNSIQESLQINTYYYEEV